MVHILELWMKFWMVLHYLEIDGGIRMDREFYLAVCKYYDIVKEKCESLINHINLRNNKSLNNKYNLFSYLVSNKISNYQCDGYNYIFHGCGCTVFLDDTIIADWDFGYRSLWCGIDAYKMSLTLKNNEYINSSFYETDFICDLCKTYTSQGDLVLYKNQYYINLLKMGTIKTSFPAFYDELIICYNEVSMSFYKSKDIDRFIRKSHEIYKDIEELDNNYLLIFRYKNKDVYKVFYNDIAYPDSAVEIMTYKILKPYITD